MALVTKIVDTDGTTSPDYTSLSAWESAEQTDLVADGDYHEVECRASAGAADTAQVNINGWTTGASNYIRIWTASGHRHDGKYNTAKYRLELAATVINLRESYVRIEGLQLQLTASSGFVNMFVPNNITAPSDIRISDCVLKGVASGTVTVRGIYNGHADSTLTAWNCVVYDTAGGTTGEGIYNAAGTMEAYNCTTYNNTRGMRANSGTTTTVKNCVSCNNSSYDIDTTNIGTIDYCATDAGTEGTNPQNLDNTSTYANEFVDAANGDFHLVSGSVCVGNGTDDPGSGLYDDDIDGDTRTSTWDIGADEYITSALTESVSDAIAVASSHTFYESAFMTQISSVVLQDTANLYRASKKAVSDAITVLDSTTLVQVVKKAIADVVTVVDSSSFMGVFRKAISDTISAADSTSFIQAARKAISDVIAVVDDVVQTLVGGTALTQTISDMVSVVDSSSFIQGAKKAISDVISVVDSYSFVGVFKKAISDVVSMADSLVRTLVGAVTSYKLWIETQLGRGSWTETQKPKNKWTKE